MLFDVVADERNEPTYDPRMLRVEQLTQGPIGTETRFHAAVRSMGRPVEILMEITEYESRRGLASTTLVASR